MTGMEILGIALMVPLLAIVVVTIAILMVGLLSNLYDEVGPLGVIIPAAIMLAVIGGCILDNEKQKRMQVEANESR